MIYSFGEVRAPIRLQRLLHPFGDVAISAASRQAIPPDLAALHRASIGRYDRPAVFHLLESRKQLDSLDVAQLPVSKVRKEIALQLTQRALRMSLTPLAGLLAKPFQRDGAERLISHGRPGNNRPKNAVLWTQAEVY